MLHNIVVVGGGIQGTSVAYHLAQRIVQGEMTTSTTTTTTTTTTTVHHHYSKKTKITILESIMPGSAASGKGGGFMARSWGDGTPTQRLHEVAFDMYESIAPAIGCRSYRKIPVLSVAPGGSSASGGLDNARKKLSFVPTWLDGKNIGRVATMGTGCDTAQVTPAEFVEKMLDKYRDAIDIVIGTCTGIETITVDGGRKQVTAVLYSDRGKADNIQTIPADAVVVCAGPWSCSAEDWFDGNVKLPMEGIKSTSIVWKKPNNVDNVDATALFCGEDHRFGTHLEVYPRPDGTIYICGIGGSDYIGTSELKQGAFRERCEANPSRVTAAVQAFQEMSSQYHDDVEMLDRTQACMRPCPPDAMPYMGKVPGFDGAYINAGHNCWGIAWAPACGLAMSELILDGACKVLDLTPFDPTRFTPTNSERGGRGRKKQGQSVGEQW